MTTSRIVVAGAGLAGLRAVEALRSQGFDGRIEVYGDEPHAPYNRPPLSKRLLTTEFRHDDVAFRLRPNLADVTWHLGSAVRHADLTAQRLTTTDGRETRYDGLVAATGVRARRIPPAFERPDCHTLRTIDDCSALQGSLRPGCTVVIVGAGFIGCEAAAALSGAGFEVHVIETDREAMSRPIGDELGHALRIRHQAAGVRFHLASQVVSIDGPYGSPVVRTDRGLEVDCSAVIQAVGSTPNTEWLEGNGLDLSDGVLCDQRLRIVGGRAAVAAGDIARFPGSAMDQEPCRVEHWQSATTTARFAARSLLACLDKQRGDDNDAFSSVPWFWSDQGDVRLQAFGEPGRGAQMELLKGGLDSDLVARFVRAHTIVGVVLIGYPDEARRQRDSIGLPA